MSGPTAFKGQDMPRYAKIIHENIWLITSHYPLHLVFIHKIPWQDPASNPAHACRLKSRQAVVLVLPGCAQAPAT